MIFKVDPDHVVHVKGCPHEDEKAVPYRIGIESPSEMYDHLLKPDSQSQFGSSHTGPGNLYSCSKCVQAMAKETHDG